MYATQYAPQDIRDYLVSEEIVDPNNGHIWDPLRMYEAAVEFRASARQIDAAMIGFSPGWEWGTAQAWIASQGLAPLLTDPPQVPPPVIGAPVGVVTPAPAPKPAPSFPPVPPDFSIALPWPPPGIVPPAPVAPAPRPPVATVPGTPPPYQPGPAPAVPPVTSTPGPVTLPPGPIPGAESGGGGALILAALAAAAVLL